MLIMYFDQIHPLYYSFLSHSPLLNNFNRFHNSIFIHVYKADFIKDSSTASPSWNLHCAAYCAPKFVKQKGAWEGMDRTPISGTHWMTYRCATASVSHNEAQHTGWIGPSASHSREIIILIYIFHGAPIHNLLIINYPKFDYYGSPYVAFVKYTSSIWIA
jgi:hypothetical protein